MKRKLAILLAALMLLTVPALSERDETGEGHELWDLGIIIRLAENPTTGYEWVMSPDDDNELTLDGDEFTPPDGTLVGAPGLHTWRFSAGADGIAVIAFNERRSWVENRMMNDGRAVCYKVTVEGGKVVGVETHETPARFSGDEMVEFKGDETGGVPLQLPKSLVDGRATEDGLITMITPDEVETYLINYVKDGDPAVVFADLSDKQTAAKLYGSPESGRFVMDAMRGTDEQGIECAYLQMCTQKGIEYYTGYAAPNGGLLEVRRIVHFEAAKAEAEG